jgi:hypothetical protein
MGCCREIFFNRRCYNRATLNSFARHYETGEPLPEDLYQKLVAARTYRHAPLRPHMKPSQPPDTSFAPKLKTHSRLG